MHGMSIFRRKHRTETKGSANLDLANAVLGRQDLTDSASQMQVGYASNPYVYRAATLVATTIAGIRPMLLDKDDNEVQAGTDDPLSALLFSPSPGHTWRDLIYNTVMSRMLTGNAFIYRIQVRGRTQELLSVPKRCITYRPTGNQLDPVQDWQVTTGSAVITVDKADMLFIHSFTGANDVYGVSPLQAAAASIVQQNNARSWNASLTENGAKPSLVISTPKSMDNALFKQFSARLQAAFGGAGNAGKALVLDDGKTATAFGYNPVDMDYSSGITVSAREIVLAMGVPPELCGDSANKTYSNAQEANKEMVDHTIRPLMQEIYDSISSALIVPGQGRAVRVGYDAAPLADLRGDFATTITAVQTADYLTTNEKRALLSYAPVDGGDTVLQPMGKVPLAELAEPVPAVNDSDVPDDSDSGNTDGQQ